MPDLVGIDAAAKTVAEALDRLIPKAQNWSTALISSIRQEGSTLVTNITHDINGSINNLFDRIEGLAKQFSLPIQITISKPKE